MLGRGGRGGREGTGEGRKSGREERGEEENSIKRLLVHNMWDMVRGCHGHFKNTHNNRCMGGSESGERILTRNETCMETLLNSREE